MKQTDAAGLLKELILVKSAEHLIKGKLLKDHFRLTYDSLRPVNIIKSTFKEVISSPELKENLVNKTIGFAAGFLVKKVFLGKTTNPLTQLLGIVLETIVANNADDIKSVGGLILNKIVNTQKPN